MLRDLQPPPIKDRERRKKCEADDPLWLRTYLPSVFTLPFTESQLYYIRTIGEAMAYGRKKCIAAPRGDGKSSIFRYLALKYALERRIKFFLILAATGEKAGKTLDAIKDKLTRGGTLAEDYPLECMVAQYVAPSPSRARNATVHGHPVMTHWPGDYVIVPQFAFHSDVSPELLDQYGLQPDYDLSGIIMALGWKADQIQGCNVLDIRPDFVALDDLDNRDSLASEIGSVAEKIETQIETNIAGLAGVSKRLGMVMLCTVPSKHSVAYRYSDPAIKPWSGVRVRRVKTWPNDVALRDQYVDIRQRAKRATDENGNATDPDAREAHRFYLANRDAIEAGCELSNPNDYLHHEAADGSQMEVSGLQHAYNFIADHGLAAFETEYQNNPPDDQDEQPVYLTAYHIRANARSDYDRYVCPADTVLVTRGADISNGGIYWVSVAWSPEAAGAIVDFDFEKFAGMDGVPAAAAERLVHSGLQEWYARQAESPYEIHGETDTWAPDLTFIDSGWKDPKWGTQPVYLFAAEHGFRGVLPCRGIPNWRPKRPIPNAVWAYPEANVCRIPGDVRNAPGRRVIREPDVILAELHVDALKLRAHHGFLQPWGSTGSLALYTPPRDEGGRERWDRHQNFAHHIMAEEWQKQPNGTYTWVAAGQRAGGRRRAPGANHWLDALAYAIAARNLWGVSTLQTTPAPPSPNRTTPTGPPASPVPTQPNPIMDFPYLATERI